jgi:hypothetical protein
MKRILLLLVLLLNLVGIGCKSPAPEDIQSFPSEFLTQFSLRKTVDNVSPPGLNCSELMPLIRPREMPPISPSPNSVRLSQMEFYAALCDARRLEQSQEAGFILSLKSEVERQIHSTGAQVQGSMEIDNNGFQVEYAAEKIHGRVVMFGGKKECHYVVTTRIEESEQ